MAEGSDLLRLAVAKGDRSLARTLLSEGLTADLDKDGRNILHIAAQNGHLKMVQTLIDRGYDIQSQDKYGYTPLHRASAQGHLEVIEFLLNSGCPIDQQDEYGNTALHAASWNGFSQTVVLLLKKKANINACNKAGFTALHSAGQKGHNQTARVLLYAACHMNARNKYGDTPLHTSTQHGHAGVVRILLSAKCKVNIQNKNGETALHKAAINKRYKIAKLLLEAGIKKKLKNKQSETALDISKKLNDNEMVLAITSEEKLTKFPFMTRQDRSDGSCHSIHAGDKASGASDVGRMKKPVKSRQELGTGNLASASGRAAANSSFAFIRSRSSTEVELNRRRSDGQSHVTPRHTFEFSQHQIPKSEVEFIEKGIAESAHRHSPPPAPPSLSKPGHIFYRDLSGKLKQGPVGCIRSDSLLPATTCQRINKTYEDLYEPLTQMKKSQSVSRKQCCQQFSNLGNSNNLPTSNWKSETRMHGKSNAEAEKPRGHSRSRSSDFYQKKTKSCDTRRRSAAGSCEHCHGNLPTSSVYLENCLDPQYLVHGEKKAGMTIYSGQPFQSRSDETILTRSEQQQKQLTKCHHHMMQIPNADDDDSSDESNPDWTISHAPRRVRDGNFEAFDWHRTNASSSFGRRAHLRRTRNKDEFYHLDIGGSCMPPSRTSYNRPTSENRKNEALNAFKENRNSSKKISVAEHCKNLGNNAQCPKVNDAQCPKVNKKEQSNVLQHCYDAPSLSTDDRLLHGKSKEHVLMASSIQSTICNHVVSCHNRSDNRSFCPICMHKNLNTTCRADTGSNHDSGYGSKIYHNMSDCIAYSQHPTEAKCKDDEKNSVKLSSKELVNLSGRNYNKISKISADDQVMNENHIKRVSRHVGLHTNFETTHVDVYRQPNCSSTPRPIYNQCQANGGSDLSIVSEHSDCQTGQSEHFDMEDFDQHRTLTLSKALADKSIEYIDAVDSFGFGQKHEAI